MTRWRFRNDNVIDWRKSLEQAQQAKQVNQALVTGSSTAIPFFASDPVPKPEPKSLEFLFQTEPIVAYRLFSVADYELRHGEIEPRLIPIAQLGKGIFYPTLKRFEAQCVHSYHEAPSSTCSCGVWALKEESQLVVAAGGYGQHRVWGEVYLWGRVLEGARGYRAQYAYPKALFCIDRELAAKLQLLYGIPVKVADPLVTGPVTTVLGGVVHHPQYWTTMAGGTVVTYPNFNTAGGINYSPSGRNITWQISNSSNG